MSVKSRIFTLLALALFSPFAHARMQGLNCEKVDEEFAKVKTRITDDARVQIMNNMYADVIRLIDVLKKPPAGVPINFLRRCYTLKRDTFFINLGNGSGALRESFDAHYKSAIISEMLGEMASALKSYDKAMKLREDDPDVRLKYFQVWRDVARTQYNNTKSQGYGVVNYEDYMREFNRIVEPILRMDKANRDHKVAALRHRVNHYLDMSEHNRVIQDYERILALDPADKDALDYAILFHCEGERFNPMQCKKYLESYVPKFPENKATAVHLIGLQLDEGDTSGALLLSKKFLEYYPNDPDFMAWRAKVLWKVGRLEESQTLVGAVLAVNPSHPVALSTRAMTLLKDAEAFEKRGLLSNALKSLEDALAIVKKAGIENTSDALQINEKMAFIIYDFLGTQNYKATEASRADAKRIVELLTPSFKNSGIRRGVGSLVDTYFHALELAGVKTVNAGCQLMLKNNVAISSSARALRACSSLATAPDPAPTQRRSSSNKPVPRKINENRQ